MTRRSTALTLFALLAFAPASTLAQSPAADEPAPQRRTVIDFEDELIEGTLQRPDVPLVKARPKPAHKNLIRLRESFRREMMGSIGGL